MFALAMSGALVWLGLSCLQASRQWLPLIFRAVRRPVVSGSLGRLVCSLIDGLSVRRNYPRPDWEAGGDFVDCHVHSKVNKPKGSSYIYDWHPQQRFTAESIYLIHILDKESGHLARLCKLKLLSHILLSMVIYIVFQYSQTVQLMINDTCFIIHNKLIISTCLFLFFIVITLC